ncbi:MAG: CdvA-like protein [Candidatus Bathyarchaeota archaeon]|nr:CdvA-like protein [Candidatus Termiticorpusculum sp.]MCL2868581.1 CdvA-like protein [Candidatus Termiticorpusculum sp.]
MSSSNLFLSLGKPIKNEYGKVIGKVASFALDPNGKFDAVFVEFSDGQFSKQAMDNLRFNGSEITFVSKIKSQANMLCDQIPLLWRKDQAIKDLHDKQKITHDLFQELHNSFEGVLNQLKKDGQVIIDEASVEIARCDEEIKSLSYAIANLELEHEIGQVAEETYQTAFNLLQDSLKRATTERADYEIIKSKVSSILIGDPSTLPKANKVYAETVTTQQKPVSVPVSSVNDNNTSVNDLPEPPVVVYVKEIGKAGL